MRSVYAPGVDADEAQKELPAGKRELPEGARAVGEGARAVGRGSDGEQIDEDGAPSMYQATMAGTVSEVPTEAPAGAEAAR